MGRLAGRYRPWTWLRIGILLMYAVSAVSVWETALTEVRQVRQGILRNDARSYLVRAPIQCVEVSHNGHSLESIGEEPVLFLGYSGSHYAFYVARQGARFVNVSDLQLQVVDDPQCGPTSQ